MDCTDLYQRSIVSSLPAPADASPRTRCCSFVTFTMPVPPAYNYRVRVRLKAATGEKL